MARRWVAAILIVLIALVATGFVITYLQKARMNAHLAASQNNLRQLALFAAHHSNRDPSQDPAKIPREIPLGTVVLAGQPPENRLSWFVSVLPGLDQRRQDVVGLLTQINEQGPWSDPRNQEAARTRLLVALCPLYTQHPPADQPAITCYVGIAGVGVDAPHLALPPLPERAPKLAGAFRYDAATPFDRIGDGLSQTLLLAETADDLGPWLRGGSSTVRGVDDGKEARPLIGPGGQFGGYFSNGGNFALCDGSVRLITSRISPDVFLRLATIDEGEVAVVPE
jgi:prepilin-type processing-associated H-X9-DG protein